MSTTVRLPQISPTTEIWVANSYWSLYSQCCTWNPNGGVDIWECIRPREWPSFCSPAPRSPRTPPDNSTPTTAVCSPFTPTGSCQLTLSDFSHRTETFGDIFVADDGLAHGVLMLDMHCMMQLRLSRHTWTPHHTINPLSFSPSPPRDTRQTLARCACSHPYPTTTRVSSISACFPYRSHPPSRVSPTKEPRQYHHHHTSKSFFILGFHGRWSFQRLWAGSLLAVTRFISFRLSPFLCAPWPPSSIHYCPRAPLLASVDLTHSRIAMQYSYPPSLDRVLSLFLFSSHSHSP